MEPGDGTVAFSNIGGCPTTDSEDVSDRGIDPEPPIVVPGRDIDPAIGVFGGDIDFRFEGVLDSAVGAAVYGSVRVHDGPAVS